MDTNIPDWDTYFMNIAHEVSTRSKDPNTKVGCIIVNEDKHPISTGYNGFPEGMTETESMWQRPEKYDHVIHAEVNAIAHAAKEGISTKDATIYVTAFPCLGCAKVIVASGIKRLVADKVLKGVWDEDHKKSFKLLNSPLMWSVKINHA